MIKRSFKAIVALAAATMIIPACSSLDSSDKPGVELELHGAQDLEATPPTSGNENVEGYLTMVFDDLGEAWGEWFVNNGLEEPGVGYVIVQPGKTYHTKCDGGQIVNHKTPNAFYCGVDSLTVGNGVYEGVIILPRTTIADMFNGVILGIPGGVQGDFAVAGAVAHEFGHHIAHELSLQLNVPRASIKNDELLADCFAGNWTVDLFHRNRLEDGDIEEFVTALAIIADPAPGGNHGTAKERASAFSLGMNSTPSGCINAYWK